jgi:clathrin heavy chain
VDLCRLVIHENQQQPLENRVQLVEKWLGEDQLECSEELGDMLKPVVAPPTALKVYYKGGAHQKVINSFMEQGQTEKIIEYAKKTNAQADYSQLLRNIVTINSQQAVDFAKTLLNNSPPLTDIQKVRWE